MIDEIKEAVIWFEGAAEAYQRNEDMWREKGRLELSRYFGGLAQGYKEAALYLRHKDEEKEEEANGD